MPILPLPALAARQLGATFSISNSIQLVKELLDNAIDSGATSIIIRVSSDTTSRIEVVDNGRGISPNDFDALGRPGYTSKLTTLDDLPRVGATSLGFRGVALASISELSSVKLTTRTEAEVVATTIRLLNGGGVEIEGRRAAPVGTTAFVVDVFSKVPVRAHMAKKEASKTIAKIKELIQSYSLARSQLKMVFKVLEEPEPCLIYTPRPTFGPKEAFTQLFGADLAPQFAEKTFYARDSAPDGRGNNDSKDRGTEDNDSFAFEALLPLTVTTSGKALNGTYISVDSRPIVSTRGIGNELRTRFKEHLGQFAFLQDASDGSKNLFLLLNITCPQGSYDVNIESAKDSVLFADEKTLLDQFGRFLSLVYPLSGGKTDDFHPLDTATESANPNLRHNRSPTRARTPWGVDMSLEYDDLSDDDVRNKTMATVQLSTHKPNLNGPKFSDKEPVMEGLNPWTIAKLGAPRHPPVSRLAKTVVSEPRFPLSPSPDFISAPQQREEITNGMRPEVVEGHTDRDYRVKPAVQSYPPPGSRSKVPGGPYRRPLPASRKMPSEASRQGIRRERRSFPSNHCNGISAGHEERPSSRHRPDGLVQRKISFSTRRIPRHNWSEENRRHQPVYMLPSQADRAINRDAREHLGQVDSWERIGESKSRLIAHVSTQPSHSQHPDLGPSTSRDERPATVIHLANGHGNGEGNDDEIPNGISADDKRAYLIKKQRSIANDPHKKLRRLRTDKLPLESTPSDLETHALVLSVTLNLPELADRVLKRSAISDDYMSQAPIQSKLTCEEDINFLQRKVAALLSNIGVRAPGVELNLQWQ